MIELLPDSRSGRTDELYPKRSRRGKPQGPRVASRRAAPRGVGAAIHDAIHAL